MSLDIWKTGIHRIRESRGRAVIDTECEENIEGNREHKLSFSDEHRGTGVSLN